MRWRCRHGANVHTDPVETVDGPERWAVPSSRSTGYCHSANRPSPVVRYASNRSRDSEPSAASIVHVRGVDTRHERFPLKSQIAGECTRVKPLVDIESRPTPYLRGDLENGYVIHGAPHAAGGFPVARTGSCVARRGLHG